MKRILAWGLVLCMLLFSGCRNTPESTPVSAPQTPTVERISLVALGDNLLHMPVVNSGKTADGYAYPHLFENLQPMIKEGDLAIIGQETVFGGKERGYSGYPMFNSPSDMGKTLVSEGFDVVLHASNHILDRGDGGVFHTLDFWSQYPHISVLGINNSQEEQDTVPIREVKGAKIAMLNYTYGTNGLATSIPYLVNYIDEGKMQRDATYAEEHADFTIAFMHWGTEYSLKPDDEQKRLAKLLCQWGVDLVIGSHPHVIEPVEWVESENGNRMLVYYSLGNFVSRQLEAKNLLGGLARVDLLYDGKTVTLDKYAFIPIVTHYDTTYTQFAVYPLYHYTDDLAKNHGVAGHDGPVSIKRYHDLIGTVFAGYDGGCVLY